MGAVPLGESPDVDDRDVAVLRDFAGPGVPIHSGDVRGAAVTTTTT